jgi:hypothetical protein
MLYSILSCVTGYGARPRRSQLDETQRSFSCRFAAVNECIAKLTLHDSEEIDYGPHALSTMRSALESPLSEPPPPEKHYWLLGYLPAAAKLVETTGPLMRSWEFESPPNM